jgi:hypothetical protein
MALHAGTKLARTSSANAATLATNHVERRLSSIQGGGVKRYDQPHPTYKARLEQARCRGSVGFLSVTVERLASHGGSFVWKWATKRREDE